jgi:hypothetical protein
MVRDRAGERGVALVFALATLTLVAMTIASVAGALRSRGSAVTLDERSVRVAALCDAAVAETLAGLAEGGATYRGIAERRFPGGTISSTVRPVGEWEADVVAVGRRGDWQMTARLRVLHHGAPRVQWWQRTQGPASDKPAPASE